MSSPLFEHPTVHGAISLALGRRPTGLSRKRNGRRDELDQDLCERARDTIRRSQERLRALEQREEQLDEELVDISLDLDRLASSFDSPIAENVLSALASFSRSVIRRDPIGAAQGLSDIAAALEQIGERREAARLGRRSDANARELEDIVRDRETTRTELLTAETTLVLAQCR